MRPVFGLAGVLCRLKISGFFSGEIFKGGGYLDGKIPKERVRV
jgi:hypothetical protein